MLRRAGVAGCVTVCCRESVQNNTQMSHQQPRFVVDVAVVEQGSVQLAPRRSANGIDSIREERRADGHGRAHDVGTAHAMLSQVAQVAAHAFPFATWPYGAHSGPRTLLPKLRSASKAGGRRRGRAGGRGQGQVGRDRPRCIEMKNVGGKSADLAKDCAFAICTATPASAKSSCRAPRRSCLNALAQKLAQKQLFHKNNSTRRHKPTW